MKYTRICNVLAIGILLLSCSKKEITPPAPVLPVPTEAQLKWHEMEMNAFIHYTANTFTGLEWGYGDESPAIFNPSAKNTDQWISTLKDAPLISNIEVY